LLSAALLAASLVACQKAEQVPAAEAPSSDTEGEATAPEDLSEDEADLLAQIEQQAQEAESPAAPEAAKDADVDGAREVIYRVSREGLRIMIGEAEFVPTAVSFRTAGGYGVRFTVEAKAEKEMILFAPKNGPLAFGGFVEGGEKKPFGDKREGGSEVVLSPGRAVNFTRTWPEPGQPALRAGQKLELHVGLWGLGYDSADRRPVHRFAVVKMTAGSSGAQPVVEPPAQ
jgi:hypothetical protein